MPYTKHEYLLDEKREENDFFTLYVSNLPIELKADGIAQIFKSYGQVCDLFMLPDAHWAYVKYKTYKEAEYAIRALNQSSPLYLNVAFRKKTVQSKSVKYPPLPVDDRQFQLECHKHSQNQISDIVPHTQKLNLGALATSVARMPHCDAFLNTHSVYPTELDPSMYNPVESRGRYADTNTLWSRGCTNIDENGKRWISMGRGYTRYNVPEPHPQIEEYIGRAMEIRRHGFYQYGNDLLSEEIGKCSNCGSTAKLRCARCNTYYCCRECQIVDWPHHKMDCKIIPALVGEFEATGLSSSNVNDQFACVAQRPRNRLEMVQMSSLRRPKGALHRSKPNICAKSEILNNDTPTVDRSLSSSLKVKPSAEQQQVEKEVGERDIFSPVTACTESNVEQNAGQNVQALESFEHLNARAKERNKAASGPDPFSPDHRSAFKEYKLPPPIGQNDIPPPRHTTKSTDEAAKLDFIKMGKDFDFEMNARAEVETMNHRSQPRFESLQSLGDKQEIVKRIRMKCTKSLLIPNDRYTDVVVVFTLADKTMWVNRKEDCEKLQTMMVELNEKADGFPKADNIVVGATYAIKYEDIWHRATVITANFPDPANVLYIDYGNAEPSRSNDFRLLNDFPNYPAFAIHLRPAPNFLSMSITPDEHLSVKMMSVDEDGIGEVEIRGATDKSPSSSPAAGIPVCKPSNSSQHEPIVVEDTNEVPALSVIQGQHKLLETLPNAIDSLSNNAEGYMQVSTILDNSSYAVCVLTDSLMEQYQMVYERLTEICNVAVKRPDFSPKIGDLVCGKRDNFWLRGYVLSLGPPVRLALIDDARISPVADLMPMPVEYEKIYSFGSICKIQVPGSNLNIEETAQFRVIRVDNATNDEFVEAIFLAPERLQNVTFTIKRWKPTAEQKGVSLARLENNTAVCVTSYHSERIMYVRSLDEKSMERTQRMLQNVAKWAQTAPKLDGPPAIGQFVIAQFTDGNYYRATVTGLRDDKIQVSYIDYGNREVTTIDKLRLLSDELKEQECCQTKVILKDIQMGTPPTEKVHEYLDYLVGTEQPLICTFEGNPSKDGVKLVTASGECVNDRINTFLTPEWQRNDPSKNLKCFMLEDLKTAELGQVGHTVQALLLYSTDPPFKYVMAAGDNKLLAHVIGVMAISMKKYCESTKKHYIPRTEELCLAPYDDAWYRGVCINPHETPTRARIYFVDFGNFEVVDHTDIREMTQDFMSPAALGVPCIVKNLGIQLVNGKVPDNIQKRLGELIRINQFIDLKIVGKIVNNEIAADYEIELPTVRHQLIAEGLVQP